jgi:hypothetical protein
MAQTKRPSNQRPGSRVAAPPDPGKIKPIPIPGAGIPVRAVRKCYYGIELRYPGDEFVVRNESEISKKAMVRLDGKGPVPELESAPSAETDNDLAGDDEVI